MRKQGIYAVFLLRRLEGVFGFPILLLNYVIKLHSQRPIGIVAVPDFIAPKQIVPSVGEDRGDHYDTDDADQHFLHG